MLKVQNQIYKKQNTWSDDGDIFVWFNATKLFFYTCSYVYLWISFIIDWSHIYFKWSICDSYIPLPYKGMLKEIYDKIYRAQLTTIFATFLVDLVVIIKICNVRCWWWWCETLITSPMKRKKTVLFLHIIKL